MKFDTMLRGYRTMFATISFQWVLSAALKPPADVNWVPIVFLVGISFFGAIIACIGLYKEVNK